MAQFRFGNFDFPDKYIKKCSPKVKPNQRQSLDPYTDMYGVTHDNGLPHTKTEIQFTTLSMSGSEFRTIMSGITENYIDYKKRNANCTYYDDESGTFKTGEFYLDKSFQANRDEVDQNGVPTKYDEIDWLFIEY